MKQGIRILGIACSPLKSKKTMLIGIISKMGYVEGVISTEVEVDGTDSTQKISKMINSTRFGEQIRLIAMNGIGVAGLNVVDLIELQKRTNTKIISVTRKKPHPDELIVALKTYSKLEKENVDERIRFVNDLEKLNEFRINGFYLQTSLDKVDARKFFSEAYEKVRLAHLIASGIDTGVSSGGI